MKKTAIIYMALSLLTVTAFGQANNGLLTSLSAIAGMRDRFPIEKLYLQFDKPHYTSGDTLRFKAYLMNGDFLMPSTKSGILYITMNNAANRVVKQVSVPLASGMGWGNVALDDIRPGNYTLRAFTNWMLNFGEDYLVKKTIYIAPLNSGTTLVKVAYKLENTGNKDKVNVGLELAGLNGEPLRLKDMRLKLGTKYRWLYNDKVNTGMDGRMHINFNIADKTETKSLYIQVQQEGKGVDTTTFTIPVDINRPENTDIQFMPEGGNMVAGIPIKIAFKAISEDGKGATVSGKVYNHKQQEVAQFQSVHKGMGGFELTPQEGDSYTAKITLPDNTTLSYPLPTVKATGTTLKVVSKSNDSLEVTLNATPDLLNKPADYYLIGETRGMVCYTALISFKGPTIKKTIAKDLFPAGIAHFTLFSSANQPLNERMFYIGHKEVIQVTLTTSRPQYTIRDSVAVAIAVKDKNGKPVRGNFSLAVTDDSQVHTDSTGDNLVSHSLLTTDLKGNIEEPAWYFEKTSPDRVAALDNLLLTQGWIGYDWKAIFNPAIQKPQHQAEAEFVVQGKLTNVLNNPLKHIPITLLQKQPTLAMETQTNDDGLFVFKNKNLFPTDSSYYLVQVRHKNGENRDFNVGLEIDVPNVPVFSAPKERVIPWYFNTDSTLLNNTSIKMAEQKAEADYKGEGNMLKEVEIKSTKIIPDSHNLNGPGQSDISLNEADMNKEKSRTLLDLLLHKFPDFHVEGHTYYLGRQQIVFFFDGVYSWASLAPIDMLMDWFTATDIKGIEIMKTDPFTYYYYAAIRRPWTRGIAFLEITTYTGVGPFIKHKAGRYVYKPIGLTFPKAFYSPKYTVKTSTLGIGTDLRSTIYWEPDIVTDKEGKATVSFYSADRPTDYTLILEGTDLKGGFGYSRQKIKIAPTATAVK